MLPVGAVPLRLVAPEFMGSVIDGFVVAVVVPTQTKIGFDSHLLPSCCVRRYVPLLKQLLEPAEHDEFPLHFQIQLPSALATMVGVGVAL